MTTYRPTRRQAIKAPAHLSKEAQTWWKEVLRDYDLGSDELKVLQVAAECMDEMRAAAALIREQGLVVDGRQGKKPNPAVAIQRDARLAFLRAIRALGLHDDGPRGPHPSLARSIP